MNVFGALLPNTNSVCLKQCKLPTQRMSSETVIMFKELSRNLVLITRDCTCRPPYITEHLRMMEDRRDLHLRLLQRRQSCRLEESRVTLTVFPPNWKEIYRAQEAQQQMKAEKGLNSAVKYDIEQKT